MRVPSVISHITEDRYIDDLQSNQDIDEPSSVDRSTERGQDDNPPIQNLKSQVTRPVSAVQPLQKQPVPRYQDGNNLSKVTDSRLNNTDSLLNTNPLNFKELQNSKDPRDLYNRLLLESSVKSQPRQPVPTLPISNSSINPLADSLLKDSLAMTNKLHRPVRKDPIDIDLPEKSQVNPPNNSNNSTPPLTSTQPSNPKISQTLNSYPQPLPQKSLINIPKELPPLRDNPKPKLQPNLDTPQFRSVEKRQTEVPEDLEVTVEDITAEQLHDTMDYGRDDDDQTVYYESTEMQTERSEGKSHVRPPTIEKFLEEKPKAEEIKPSSGEIWNAAVQEVEKGNLEGAYSRILALGNIQSVFFYKIGDDIYLMRLMKITGPCLKKLNRITASKLLKRMILIQKSGYFDKMSFSLMENAHKNKITHNMKIEEHNLVLNLLYNMSGKPDSLGPQSAHLYHVISSDLKTLGN
jgi:hypothetical protein